MAVQPRWHPSPNFGPRRDGLTPQFVVLHYTAMDSACAALDRLCDPQAEVSAHYLIGADGTLWQMVEEPMRAWHAGAGQWQGFEDINSRSVGIEIDNRGSHPFAEPQMAVLDQLLAQIIQRWDIAPDAVIGHSDMAPGRKFDPGPRFDWARLARQGLATSRAKGQGGPADWSRFRDMARACGYSAPVEDAALLGAVRLRHRPQGHGPLCAADMDAVAGD